MTRYEGMFLFDSSIARDWAAIEQEVRRLCGRIDAELLVCVKFDERRLAYEIKRRRRGTYVLSYFDAPPERIADMERDARLSDLILRLLVLRAEGLSDERLAELRAHPAEEPLQPLSGDGRRHDDDRTGRGPRGARGDRGAPRRRPSEQVAEGTTAPEEPAAPQDEPAPTAGGVSAPQAPPPPEAEAPQT